MKGLLLAATLTLPPAATTPLRDVARGAPSLAPPVSSEERVLRLAAAALAYNAVPTFAGVAPKEVERVFSKAFLPSGAIDPAWWSRFDDLVIEESSGTRSVELASGQPDGQFKFFLLIDKKVRVIRFFGSGVCVSGGPWRQGFFIMMRFRRGPKPFADGCGR